MYYEEMNPDPEEDPADFLLSNTKYHDCHLTVGDPESDKVEKIGVSSAHLIAHSSVFRHMLAESDLADPAGENTHIKDVLPATFKLMLRYVYGGSLPYMTPEEKADLAFCADKYNLQRLVGKVAKRLEPTHAQDPYFIPAFMVVMYIKCPDLEHEVTKIIQQETNMVFHGCNFLELNENCILFIVKQSMLSITELELWNSLVLWAKVRVHKHPEKTLRDCLDKALPYIRLLTVTHEEIENHVSPTNVLTPDELMDLTSAVVHKHLIQSPKLCNLKEKRLIYKEEEHYVLKSNCCDTRSREWSSSCTIETTERIKIDTLMFESATSIHGDQYNRVIDHACHVTISSAEGILQTSESFTLTGSAVPNQKTITLHVRKQNGQSVILEANKTYNVKMETSPDLPVQHPPVERPAERRTAARHRGGYVTDIFPSINIGHGMTVKFEKPFHLLEIAYRIIE